MILLYAYINRYKNYDNQEFCFDSSYDVKFVDGTLSIEYKGGPSYRHIIGTHKLDNLHILIGKTGSGKTNLLQLIGTKHDVRIHRAWNGEEDSYFFLYKINDKEFFLEICNVSITQFPEQVMNPDDKLSKKSQVKAARMDSVRSVRFCIDHALDVDERISDFSVIQEYGENAVVSDKVRYTTAVINCYDINAFIDPPYVEEKENYDDFTNDWIGRMVHPYHRTTLWSKCRYIRDYIDNVEGGKEKRGVSLVLKSENFSNDFPVELPFEIEDEYWTYKQLAWDVDNNFIFNIEEEQSNQIRQRIRNLKKLSNKEKFIHDLWTDYAIYLRKWAEKITEPYDEEEDNDYQEYVDDLSCQDFRDGVDPTILPDGKSMPIDKRCLWLAEYIDRADNRDPHGILWQVWDDIKDICNLLRQFDNKYFTIDTFSIPVVDMDLPFNRERISDLFERMEQYKPDNIGIFTEHLLPYSFSRLSTGEYQYVKVLGGLDNDLRIGNHDGTVLNKIILMDEPDAYMHPELTRQFIKRIYDVVDGHRYNKGSVQIIIGTHSPFLVSDVCSDMITRLSIDPDSGKAIVLQGSDRQYFGANLYTIFSDGFFLDYTIGEFSRNILQQNFNHLQKLEGKSELSTEDRIYLDNLDGFVSCIGEPIIKRAFEIRIDQLRGRR